MAEDFAFTIGFIDKHPRSAARALASLDPTDVAAFLDKIPENAAAMVLSQMNAGPAAMVIKRMDGSAGVLAEMNYQDAVSVVRSLEGKSLRAISDKLAPKLRRDLKTTLSFPPDTVGAQMTTTIVTMTGDQTAAEALVELRRMRRTKAPMVFIIDASKRLLGAVATADLLHSPDARPLAQLMDTGIVPLSARARLDTVTSFSAWTDYSQLPVLDGQKRLIGSLSKKIAWQTSLRAPATIDGIASPSIAASMANAFFTSFAGLMQLLADVDQPPAKATSPRGPGGEP